MLETEEDEEVDPCKYQYLNLYIASDHEEYDERLYDIMQHLGYDRAYLKRCMRHKQHTYGTTGMHLIIERFGSDRDQNP